MNVKAGDLAIIINSPIGINIGKICEVIRPSAGNGVPIGEIYNEILDRPMRFKQNSDSFRWVCKLRSPVVCVDGPPSLIAYVADKNLRPISGLPEADEVTKEKELTV